MTEMIKQASAENDFIAIAEGVNFSFGGHKILVDISFVLKKGTVVLLRGDNGAGKTTLLNILSGLIYPDAGRITMHLNGRKIDVLSSICEELACLGVGRLWQDIRLFPTMTVLENVMAATPGLVGQNPLFAIGLWPLVRKQDSAASEIARKNLRITGMLERAGSSCDKLSLGQMKRVALARLLQTNPQVLLLDEPLAGLDLKSANALMDVLDKLKTNERKAIIVVEHQHERFSDICDETWFLSDGKLQGGEVN